MSKDNRYLPPAPKQDSRLINLVIRSRKYKRPNAQKHGVFATPVIIPGENLREFHALLAELMDEWKPLGPSLRHAVHCLADSMWRMRRLKKSVQTELWINTFDPQHPAFKEEWGDIMFLSCLGSEQETCFEKHAKKYLRPDKINYLEQKFPRSNYQSAAEWAIAVTIEILSTSEFESPGSEGQVAPWKEAAREWRTDQQVKGSIVYARELLEYEFKKPSASKQGLFGK
jgi:hypothetical protein